MPPEAESQYVLATVVPEGLNRKYLRVQDLRRLKHVTFTGRKIIEGLYSGRHATPQRGHSVEFRDYRQYIPGDEIESVDWKVYGRSDKLFIKIFEHQADMTVHLLVDASASMAYRGARDRHSKYDQACFLAAAIGFVVAKQQDRVSFGLAQEGLRSYQRPTSSMQQLAGMLQTMEHFLPAGEARLADAIRALLEKTRRRDLVILFSDLLDDQAAVMKAISRCLHRGGEVIVFHVLSADELELPRIENGRFIDSESRATVRLNVEDVRPEYDERMKAFLAGWSKAFQGHGIDYNLVSSADDYSRALERYLLRRAAMV